MKPLVHGGLGHLATGGQVPYGHQPSQAGVFAHQAFSHRCVKAAHQSSVLRIAPRCASLGAVSEESAHSASKVFASRVKAVRERQRLHQEDVVRRLEDEYGVQMDRATLARIERGQRGISLDEALLLAAVLQVAPLHLLVDTEGTPLLIGTQVTASAEEARAWIRGDAPLPGGDSRTFYTEVPASQWERTRGFPPEVIQAEAALRAAEATARRMNESLAWSQAHEAKLTDVGSEEVRAGAAELTRNAAERQSQAFADVAAARERLEGLRRRYGLEE